MSTTARRLPAAERYAQLVDVAERLFIERGYAAVAMEDIARAAGVSKPVVYDHFKTKEGAYLACVERARDLYEQRLLGTIDLTAGPRDQLRAGAEAFFAMLEDDPGRWRLLFGSNAVLPGEATEALGALRFRTIEQIHALLAGFASNAPSDRIEACAHLVSGAGERLGHWWLTRPDLARAQVIDHFVEILWAGLREYVD